MTFSKAVIQSTFKHCTSYNENLIAVSIENKVINFCELIYFGFAVLDISKMLMYDYHFIVMKSHYIEWISLMYTDTDSFIYHIQTIDFYKDLKNNSDEWTQHTNRYLMFIGMISLVFNYVVVVAILLSYYVVLFTAELYLWVGIYVAWEKNTFLPFLRDLKFEIPTYHLYLSLAHMKMYWYF